MYAYSAGWEIDDLIFNMNQKNISLGDIQCDYDTSTKNKLSFGVFTPFGLENISTKYVGFSSLFLKNFVEVGIFQKGKNDLVESCIAIEVSKFINATFQLGIKVTLLNISSPTEFSASMVFAALNCKWIISRNLLSSFQIINPNGSYLRGTNNQIPVNPAGFAGFLYKISNQCQWYGEASFIVNKNPGINLGMEYSPANCFSLCTGIKSQPFQSTWGFGCEQKKWELFYSGSFHPILGLSTGISIGITW